MEVAAKPTPLIAIHIILILLNHVYLVHSRNLSPSPSPAPFRNPRLGSFPAACQTKCKQCKPCVPVEVTIKTMAEEENEYYPIAWKCMCHSNIFSP